MLNLSVCAKCRTKYFVEMMGGAVMRDRVSVLPPHSEESLKALGSWRCVHSPEIVELSEVDSPRSACPYKFEHAVAAGMSR
jgi:hypothetical protein